MKKLLSIAAVLTLFGTNARAMSVQTPTVVVDTLHYFFNKYYFKTGVDMKSFPYYKSPAATSTAVSHVGVKFENDEPIDITGLEGFMRRHESSTKTTITVRMYLCTLENDLPKLPPLDSVQLSITGDTIFSGPIGADFPAGRVHTLTGDFAVLARNMSLTSGDTVRIMRTAGRTATANVAPEYKNSDGFGYLRVRQGSNTSFFKTTNFNAPGFGNSTDYEFCLAPRVQYTLTADHQVDPKATKPLCTWEPMTVTSLASKRFLRRQYNLVEFARRWNWNPPFKASTLKIDTGGTQPVDVFPSDSSISWYFAPEDNEKNQPHPRFFLPYNTTNNQMVFYTDSSSYTELGADSVTCFETNEFRTRFKPMSIYGRGRYMIYNDTFIICTSYCGVPYVVGVTESKGFEKLRLYPNPAGSSATLSGLVSGAAIRVYNMLGSVVMDEKATGEKLRLDLSALPSGTYLVRVSDGDRSRTLRMLRE